MKRIALLTDGIFPYVVGGMQKHSFYLAKYFAKNKVEVDLYHFNQSSYDINALELFTEEEKKYIFPIVLEFPSAGRLPGHYLKESYQYSASIYDKLKLRPRVDFIYAKGFTAWKLLEAKEKGEDLPKIGVNFHGYEMFQTSFGWRSQFSKLFLKGPVIFNARHADLVFSYGGKITQLIREIGVNVDRIIEIPTGIESNWINTALQSSTAERKFVFIGRNERRKGLPELNTIIGHKLKDLNFKFEFIGPIPEKDQVSSSNVKYHGMISDEEKLKMILRSADVLVCPSHSEGMPNVIMEGMASGLAIIATNVGAVANMVDEQNGWLCEAGDTIAIEKAIRSAIGVPGSELDKMKMNSIQKVEQKFLWDKLILETIDKIDNRIKT